jgi:uncharacterized protein with NRDE domain
MCTLTYIPTERGAILTSNRDEHDSRGDTNFPVEIDINNLKVVFPQDPKAGGTWIACASNQSVAILLNGAFEKHKHRPPYRKSRGLVLLDLFKYDSFEEFNSQYNLNEIEPFTIVYFKNGKTLELTELRWDGKQKHLTKLNAKIPHIWSSATLYSPEVILERRHWFSEMLASENISPGNMQHFHEFGGKSDEKNNFKMDRGNGLRSIRISQIIIDKRLCNFEYRNFVNNTSEKTTIITETLESSE